MQFHQVAMINRIEYINERLKSEMAELNAQCILVCEDRDKFYQYPFNKCSIQFDTTLKRNIDLKRRLSDVQQTNDKMVSEVSRDTVTI